MHNDAHKFAVADDFLEVIFNGLLTEGIGPLLVGLGESLLLALVPMIRIVSRMVVVVTKRRTNGTLINPIQM